MTGDLDWDWPAIRGALKAVALPDSRFDLDLDQFIPAFPGVGIATDRLCGCAAYRAARTLFVTPDNAMQELRHRALADGKALLVPTYGLRRGFLRLDPARLDPAQALFASWGDGIEHFGVPVAIDALVAVGAVDLVVAGAAAVTTGGVRFGMGHRYLDVEWDLLRAAALLTDRTPVWTIVDDCQLLDRAAAAAADAVPVDRIFTPGRLIETGEGRRPSRLLAETLASLFGDSPPPAIAGAVRHQPDADRRGDARA